MTYPHLRAYPYCPLCHAPKPAGALCCPRCDALYDVTESARFPDSASERTFRTAEANLATAAAEISNPFAGTVRYTRRSRPRHRGW